MKPALDRRDFLGLMAGAVGVLFAAFAGWDAAGAKAFGFPTVWVNRLSAPVEELGVAPDVTCHDLSGLVTFATSHR